MMPISARNAWALGWALVGMTALAGLAQAQNEPAQTAAPAAGTQVPPARIGTIDMDKVFKDYKKVKFSSDQLKNEATAKQAELQKLMAQMRELAGQLEALAPGSGTFKEKESEITKLKVQYEAEREQAQAEFARREADAIATIYKEVQAMSASVARHYGLTFIVKISGEPVSGNDPNSVMAAMARTVVHSDPSADITNVVVHNLNLAYERQAGAQAPRAAAPAVDPATRPAAATAAPPPRAAARPNGPPATRR